VFFAGFEDELDKVAKSGSGAIEMLRNQARRKKWLRPGASERFVSAKKELKALKPKPPQPKTTKIKTASVANPAHLARLAVKGAAREEAGPPRSQAMLRERIREGGSPVETEEERKKREAHLRALTKKAEEDYHPAHPVVSAPMAGIGALLGGATGTEIGHGVGEKIDRALDSRDLKRYMAQPRIRRVIQGAPLRREYVTFGDDVVRLIESAMAMASPLKRMPPAVRASVAIPRMRTIGGIGGALAGGTGAYMLGRGLFKRDRDKESMSKAAWMLKKAGSVKRTCTIDGLTMRIEYDKGDVRFKGAPHERKMLDCYGHMPGTYGKGLDGEAIDIYVNPALEKGMPLGSVFKVTQLKKGTGEVDEEKFMLGYDSAADAKKAFLRNMPSWAFGSMTSMDPKAFRKLVGQ
jgi:hypothetical protein